MVAADNCPLPNIIPSWGDTLNGKWANVRSYCTPIIRDCVERHGLDIGLVSAIIMQESGGNPNAYNPSGATGLMQVMPDSVIPGRPTISELLDPEFNIQTGCNILSAYIKRHNGSVRDGLWAYGGTDGSYAQYADIVLNVYDIVKSAP